MVGLPLFGKEGSGTSVFKILVRVLEQHLEFLSLNEAAHAHLSLFMSKCLIVGYHMSRLKCYQQATLAGKEL